MCQVDVARVQCRHSCLSVRRMGFSFDETVRTWYTGRWHEGSCGALFFDTSEDDSPSHTAQRRESNQLVRHINRSPRRRV